MAGVLVHVIGVIAAARRGDEHRPAVVLLNHRSVIGPRRRIAQCPLRVDDAAHRGTDGGVVAIAAHHLHGAAVDQTNEHRLIIDAAAQLRWKRFVDATLAGVWIDRGPDRFAGLLVFRQAVPEIADALRRCHRKVMQTNLVLAGSAMPHHDRALAAIVQITPERVLVPARSPTVMR
jgi:hypothetical protein